MWMSSSVVLEREAPRRRARAGPRRGRRAAARAPPGQDAGAEQRPGVRARAGARRRAPGAGRSSATRSAPRRRDRAPSRSAAWRRSLRTRGECGEYGDRLMRVLLTGATGKIGNAVARRLLERGDEVVALVRDPEGARELLPEDGRARRRATSPIPTRCAAPRGVDAAINCMGIFEQWTRDPTSSTGSTRKGPRRRPGGPRGRARTRRPHLDLRRLRRRRGGTVSEARVADYDKGTAYERSKQLAERLVLAEGEHGIEVVLVNPRGDHRPGTRGPSTGWDALLRDAIRGRLPLVPPGGMTLTWVEDAADATSPRSTAAGRASATSSPTASRPSPRSAGWRSRRPAAAASRGDAGARRARGLARSAKRWPARPAKRRCCPAASSTSCSGRRARTRRRPAPSSGSSRSGGRRPSGGRSGGCGLRGGSRGFAAFVWLVIQGPSWASSPGLCQKGVVRRSMTFAGAT